ncbi:MAG: hypothetical protein H6604_06850 [Flavobacteriales bacterium]|nr:hypothetical protein [Flavobacteriales bacterium]
MKKLYILLVLLVFVQCNSYKQAEKNLNSGNFDSALDIMLNKKVKGIKEKHESKWISLLQKSYLKANEQDKIFISRQNQTENNSEKYKNLYYTYLKLQERQDKVQKLLPIYHNSKQVSFPTEEYTTAIQNNKKKYADNLYQEAENLLIYNDVQKARDAYYKLVELEKLYPTYSNLYFIKNKAYEKGISHVLVTIKNTSNTILPVRLEQELIDFSTLSQDKFWYRFHTRKSITINFQYDVQLNLNRIFVSPEQITYNNFSKEKEIIDGWEYAKDRNGKPIVDSLGNKIKVDKYRTIYAEVKEMHQFKEAFIDAEIIVVDSKTKAIYNRNRIDSHFVFEDVSAISRGDKRALDDDYFRRVKSQPIPIPPSEQMIYDCGQDLKYKFKDFIARSFD